MTDIKLSRRMQAVVNMVKESSVVDIGCDHAFVSIYLMQSGKCHRVIAMDVKKGPVDIAKANVKAYNMEQKIDVRLSDGFKMLKPDEADCAIIAGMGGNLIIDILKEGRLHTDRGIKLILQPQSDIHEVRAYLACIGYGIEAEDMLIEDGKYYTIIRAVPLAGDSVSYNESQLMYGPCLLDSRHKVLDEYLNFLLDKNESIISNLAKAGTDNAKDRINQLQMENKLIKDTIKIYY